MKEFSEFLIFDHQITIVKHLLYTLFACLLFAGSLKAQNNGYIKFSPFGIVTDNFERLDFNDITLLANDPEVLKQYDLSGTRLENTLNMGVTFGVDVVKPLFRGSESLLGKRSFYSYGVSVNYGRESIMAFERELSNDVVETITLCDMQNELALRFNYLYKAPLAQGISMEVGLGADAGMNMLGGFMIITDQFSSVYYDNYSRMMMQTGDVSTETDMYKSNKGFYHHVYVPVGLFFGETKAAFGLEMRPGVGQYQLFKGESFGYGFSNAYLITLRMGL